jgi:hypothetical protein
MNWITGLFLRAKSWEIFLLLFCIMAVSMVAIVNSIQATPVRDLGKSSLPFMGVMLLFIVCSQGWFGASGSFLNSIVQRRLRPGSMFFRLALIYPIVYIAAFLILFPPSPAIFVIIFPLHVFAMLCMFYLPIFVAKNLTLVEKGTDVTFSEYAGVFFLLWFLPIGLWIVQPRINRLYAEARNSAG